MDPHNKRFPEPPVRAHPSLQVISPGACRKLPWKNGLGETLELAIHPENSDFKKDDFIWRLSVSRVVDDCSFSLFPGYDVALLPLPELDALGMTVEETKVSGDVVAALHHNDSETPSLLKMLQPYSYDGCWPTTCRLKRSSMLHLTFIVNRKWANVSLTLETIQPWDTEAEGIPSVSDLTLQSEEDAGSQGASNGTIGGHLNQPSSKMFMGNYTIIFVVSGEIQVKLSGSEQSATVTEGETLVCRRPDTVGPAEMSMTPTLFNENVKEAQVLLIQVNTVNDRGSLGDKGFTPYDLKPMSFTKPMMRHRTSSILIFDDKAPQYPGEAQMEPQASSIDLATPLMEPAAGGPSVNWESARPYKPPTFSERYKNESEVPPPVIKDDLIIEDFPEGQMSTVWINMVKQGLSEWIRIPVIVARGRFPGPVVGITAVVHGNELNGVPCIHRVITEIDVSLLSGTVVAVPCVNVPGYLRFQREFSDGKDLNRTFPGSEKGTASSIYSHNLMTKIVSKFGYLIDLHTASFGRVNSYYVRSDMNDPVAATLAKLQLPQIILHNSGQDGTLRSAAALLGIKSITVEIGNPQLFQNRYVQWSYLGVMRILSYLSMFTAESELSMAPNMLLCSRGFWIYTRTGGVLEVYPNVNTLVRKGDLIARIKNIFGNIVDEIYCPQSGVTIGRSSNPVAQAGDRILHLGVLKKADEVLASEAKENY